MEQVVVGGSVSRFPGSRLRFGTQGSSSDLGSLGRRDQLLDSACAATAAADTNRTVLRTTVSHLRYSA